MVIEPWVIGCGINLCGSVLINVGTNLIHFHHSNNANNSNNSNNANSANNANKQCETSEECIEQTVNQSLYWYLGSALYIVGNVSNFLSMSFAPQSLLAALGSIQFVSNIVCSVRLFGRPIDRSILWATFNICMGNLLIVRSNKQTRTSSRSVEELIAQYVENRPYHVYLTCIVGSIVLMIAYEKLFEYVIHKQTIHNAHSNNARDDYSAELQSNDADYSEELLHSSITKHSKVLSVLQFFITYPINRTLEQSIIFHRTRLLPIMFACVSAMIGSQSVLFAKSCSELIRTSIHQSISPSIMQTSQINHPFTYLIFISYLVATSFWVTRLNYALQKFDGVFIIPVMQIGWTIFSILAGGLYFGEFQGWGVWEKSFFASGLGFILAGVYLLSPKPAHDQPIDECVDQPLRHSISSPIAEDDELYADSPTIRLLDRSIASTDECDSRTSSCSNFELFDEWYIQSVTQPHNQSNSQLVNRSHGWDIQSVNPQSIDQHVIDFSKVDFDLPSPPAFKPVEQSLKPSIGLSSKRPFKQSTNLPIHHHESLPASGLSTPRSIHRPANQSLNVSQRSTPRSQGSRPRSFSFGLSMPMFESEEGVQ